MNSLLSMVHKWLDGAYAVGIMESSPDDIIAKDGIPEIHWLDMGDYDDSWFADPFVIRVDDKEIELLVEEFVVAEKKGRLSRIVVDRVDYKVLSVTPILSQSTHLSYPHLIISGGKTYICPESSARGEVALYTYDGRMCSNHQRLLLGAMLDTQIAKIDNSYYAFTVEASGQGLEDTRFVQIYKSHDLKGPYQHFQNLEKPLNEGRGAGPIFTLNDGRLVRPAQNCEGGYGKGVILFELTLKDKRFEEREIWRINSDASKCNGLCLHTFSPKGGIVAVDGFDYNNRTLGRLAPKIYNMKNIINKLIHR